MRKGLIAALIASVGMLFSVAACNGGGGSSTKYEVTINNKTEMQAAWAGDAEARSLNLTIKKDGKEKNALEALSDGDLKITSSNTTVATIQGLKVSPVDGEGGKSTISVVYGNVSDNVEVTVTKANKHGKIASDPFTVAEAIAKCVEQGKDSATTQAYFVSGVVTGVTGAYDPNYGNMSFKIGATKDATDTVTVYRAKPATGVDYSIINKGSTVVVSGNLINFNGNTPEVNQGGSIVSATQGDTPQEVTLDTMAEVVATTKALGDNNCSFDIYTFTGYIVNVVSAGTFYMADTKGGVAASQDLFEVFGYNGDNKEQLTLDAKVTVRATLKYYVSTSQQGKYQVETDQIFSITILEPGQEPEIKVVGPTPLETVVAGTKYYAGALQTTINKMLFLDGQVSSNRLTTKGLANAAEVELVTSGNGYNLKVGTKFANLNNDKKFVLETSAKTVWSWDATLKSIKTTVGTDEIYATTYSTYDTISASLKTNCFDAEGKLKAGNFLLQFYAKEEAADPTEIQLNVKAIAVLGSDLTLAVRANPYNADLTKLTWKSSDETVATVAAGVVHPLKAGNAVITAQFGEDTTTVKDTCAIKVVEVNFGTAEAPLTVAQAKAAYADLAEKAELTKGAITPIPVFVKGTVEAAADMFYNNTYHGKWNVVTGEDKIYVVNSNNNTPKVYVGDEMVITGYLSDDATNGLELIKNSANVYPKVIQLLQAGTSTITVGAHEHATVQLSAESGLNGSEFTFTVTPDESYKVDAVKVNGTAITAETDGSYKSTVQGATTVTVETVQDVPFNGVKLNKVGTDTVSTASTTATNDVTNNGVTLTYFNSKKQGDALFMTNNADNPAYLYNKTALTKAIKSIEVETNSGAAAACKYAIAFSATPFTTGVAGTNGYVIGAGAKYTYDCSVTDALYFCITVSAKNGQVLNIVVNYVD